MIYKTQNNFNVMIDDEDYDKIKMYKWGAFKHHTGRYYVIAHQRRDNGKGWKTIRLHRVIMSAPENMCVDHINHDTLDNRKQNLRICTNTENRRNCISKKGTSKYKGVCWNKEMNKWSAYIFPNKKAIRLGFFKNEHDAAIAYNVAACKHFGEYALLNKVPASCAI